MSLDECELTDETQEIIDELNVYKIKRKELEEK